MAANVLLPAREGAFPAIISRTPYVRHFTFHASRNRSVLGWAEQLLDSGYALVQVDMRGRGDSDGEFEMWVSDADDGYDVVEWVAAQPWSNGKIGMAGISYKGLTQWWAAQHCPPHLTCIAPTASPVHRADDRPWVNGLAEQTRMNFFHQIAGRTHQNPSAANWSAIHRHLPLRTLDQRAGRTRSNWQRWIRHQIRYGPERSFTPDQFANLDIPVMVTVGLWQDDELVFGTWRELQKSKAVRHHRLLAGAWNHPSNPEPRPTLGGYDVSKSVIDTVAHWRRFFDYWLKDEANGLDREPRVRIFRTGAMQWEDWDDWPPPTVDVSYYLHSHGSARTLRGDGVLSMRAPTGAEPEDTFTYDPQDPVWTVDRGGEPPLDIRYIERRPDCLVYTTEPVDHRIDISGQLRCELFVSSDCYDTDILVFVTDVHPDGRSIQLGQPDGLRLRYRHPGREELLTPGRVERVEIPHTWLNHRLLPGHRLRIVITSSYWPTVTRNLNGPESPFEQTKPRVARNSVHHSTVSSSRLIVPMVAE